MRDAFIRALESLAERDPRVVLITGDLGFHVLDGYMARRPRQFLNAGVAEQNMTGLATGLALEGRIVFTYSIGNFPTLRCLEQLRNDAAYHEANVNVVAIGGGFSYGPLGMSHHATEDLAILRAIPGITVVAPADPWEVEYLVPWLAPGCVRRLRDGDAVTLIGTGGVLHDVLAAADELARRGVAAGVLAVHALRPFDGGPIVAAARDTGAIVTVEEHVVAGGLGGLVAETLLDAGVAPRRARRLGVPPDVVGTVGTQAYLRAACGLDAAGIVRATMNLLDGRS